MSLLLAVESRAGLQILSSNQAMMAGQPRVGVLNLTLWPVGVGLAAIAACPACGKESKTGTVCFEFLASNHAVTSRCVFLSVSFQESLQLNLCYSLKEESLYFVYLDLI